MMAIKSEVIMDKNSIRLTKSSNFHDKYYLTFTFKNINECKVSIFVKGIEKID